MLSHTIRTAPLEQLSNTDEHNDVRLFGAIKVFLTDDDQQFSMAVGDLLANQPGMALIGSASSIEQTLADLATARADVVVLDLYMPGGETLECIQDLRQLLPNVKVLVITGGGWAEQQVASIAAGANGFLYKPFTSSNLANAIRTVHSGKVFFDFAAIAEALNAPPPAHTVSAELLSPEDREFLELIRQRMTNTAIAALWNTGIKAVYQRRYRLKRKLGLQSTRDLVCFANAASQSAPKP